MKAVMKPTSCNELQETLQLLLEAKLSGSTQYPWEHEPERWGEFLFCALHGSGIAAGDARRSVATLTQLNLSSAVSLAKLTSEEKEFLKQVMMHCGLSESDALRAGDILMAVARVVDEKWDGCIQRFLREHGTRMVDDLASHLALEEIPETARRRIATLWLQNAANMPVLLPDIHIRDFCEHFGISEQALVEYADQLGLNVTLLDDLIALTHEPAVRTTGSPESSERQAVMTANA